MTWYIVNKKRTFHFFLTVLYCLFISEYEAQRGFFTRFIYHALHSNYMYARRTIVPSWCYKPQYIFYFMFVIVRFLFLKYLKLKERTSIIITYHWKKFFSVNISWKFSKEFRFFFVWNVSKGLLYLSFHAITINFKVIIFHDIPFQEYYCLLLYILSIIMRHYSA